jgi:putative peptidoglycan lipid II flippase
VDPAEARLVASILVAFSVGMFPFSLFQLLLRAFYAMQDTRTPALINVGAVAVNILANLALVFAFGLGVQGLALGYAAAYTFAAALSLVVIRRRIGRLDGRAILGTIARVLAASVASAAAARLAADAVGRAVGTANVSGQAIQVFAGVITGVLVFVASALILRIEEVDTVKRAIMARFHR